MDCNKEEEEGEVEWVFIPLWSDWDMYLSCLAFRSLSHAFLAKLLSRRS